MHVIGMPTIIKLGDTGDYMKRLQRVLARMKVLGLLVIGAMPASAAEWVPDHVVIVIEENLSARHLTAELGYLTSLLREGANFTNAHGIDHPSQPNYLALFSGDTQGTGSEKKRNPDGSNPIVNGRTQVGSNDLVPNTPLTTPNLGAALIAAGRSFVGYSEDLPSVGFTGASHTGPEGSGVDYQRKHNPWVNWQAANDKEIGRNQLPSTTNLPFTSFPQDDAGFSKLPTVAIIVPNQINDGHGSSAAAKGANLGLAMDDWLRRNIEPYQRWAMTHNSLLIITWDEDEDELHAGYGCKWRAHREALHQPDPDGHAWARGRARHLRPAHRSLFVAAHDRGFLWPEAAGRRRRQGAADPQRIPQAVTS